MSNKNPFEIRSEILGMAKDYLDKQYAMNVELTMKLFEQGQKTAEEMKTAYTPYSMDDLMKKAGEMYAFVTKKD